MPPLVQAPINPPALCNQYDVIVCGAGSSGSVIARRLSDDPNLQVLLIDAGSSDQIPSVQEASQWHHNIGSTTDWGYQSEPAANLNHRQLPMSMGKVLGGGSGINVMIWARGHQSDWDYFAEQAGDSAWNYQSVLDIYRRIEDWRGLPDPRRGRGGPVVVSPSSADKHPLATALISAAGSVGLPVFNSPNGEMMEHHSGGALSDVRIVDGQRQSVFESYVRPVLGRPNLTVVTDTLVDRVVLDGRQATGVELIYRGERQRVLATHQVVLSTGAINSPSILMRSGIGDRRTLAELGIESMQHLPGVGHGLQDHTCFELVWESSTPVPPVDNGSAATLYARSQTTRLSPDIVMCQAEFPMSTLKASGSPVPAAGWTLVTGLAQPQSRGRVSLRSADPNVAPRIELNALSDSHDWEVARAAIRFAQEVGRSSVFGSLAAREAIPGPMNDSALDEFLRNGATSFWHQTCTARMGRDELSVVDAQLAVHGLENLTVADGSIMPRITTGNTMAPCVIIGERAASILATKLGCTSNARTSP